MSNLPSDGWDACAGLDLISFCSCTLLFIFLRAWSFVLPIARMSVFSDSFFVDIARARVGVYLQAARLAETQQAIAEAQAQPTPKRAAAENYPQQSGVAKNN